MANKTMKLTAYQQLDFRSMSITLLGSNNNTMSGTVNLSAFASQKIAEEEDHYDDTGAAYYVCAVILVYGLSIVSLIGSLAKKKMKDNKCEQEEVQIHKYLHKVPDLREKSARDNYRQLKRNVIKLVEEKTTPEPTPETSDRGGFRFPKKHGSNKNLDKEGSRNGLDKRPATPHHHSRHKGGGKGGNKLVPPENQFLLAGEGVEEDEDDKVKIDHEPPTPTTAPTPRNGRTFQFERMQSIDSTSFEPEEKITVVQSLPSSKSDPVQLKSDSEGLEANALMRGIEEQQEGRPKYRWSLGADGNIWIMQVDEKGEEKPAPPPKVDSLPAPPSPGYTPARLPGRPQKQFPQEPVPGTSYGPSLSYEHEGQVPERRRLGLGHKHSQPQYGRPQQAPPPYAGIAPAESSHPSARSRPKLVRQYGQSETSSTRPTDDSPRPPSPPRSSPVPPENVGQRARALHPGAAQRLASTGQPGHGLPASTSHHLPHGILRPSRAESRSTSRSSSRSPSPRDPHLHGDEGGYPVTFARGTAHSPHQPRYGPRLSPRPEPRDRSRSPKRGSRHSSPNVSSSKPGSPIRIWGGRKTSATVVTSDDDEELMQVTCV